MVEVKAFFDEPTYTLTYVVYDAKTSDAVIIDPVLDYDPLDSVTSIESVEKLLKFVKEKELKVHYILETHAHADHLSSSQELKKLLPGAKLAIGEKITDVQKMFKGILELPEDFNTDGEQFDQLFKDKDVVTAGSLEFKVLHTPGHTPACVSYLFDGAVFTGDALFMPDYGTGRCDFPGGDAKDLYRSVQGRLYTLPENTKVYVGHDYLPGGRQMEYESTIDAEKSSNVQLPVDRSEEDFVEFRRSRDATLKMPRLIFQSVQVNLDGGKLPAAGKSGTRFFKMPVNLGRSE
jgi:glyoxylase-like metal-dependent hydrolase (beta-lactamase superfamily II)